MSIFDITFYGAASNFALEQRQIQIQLKRESLFLRSNWQHEIFKATVLQSYKGESYVVKLESENGYIEYVQLFDPTMVYNQETGLWYRLTVPSSIPSKILECYIKDLHQWE